MIYIVIPVHNRKAYTLGCLCNLETQTITNKRVIVVDDGSVDGTAELIHQQFPSVIVLTGDGSLWWAGAMNLGIRYIVAHLTPKADDFVLALNDDTHIQPDYLASLLSAYEANKPCMVGSASVDVNAPDRLLYAGTYHNMVFPKIENYARTRYKNDYTLYVQTSPYTRSSTLPGRGLLIPWAVFDAIGLFDDQRFRHHMADLDFSLRARTAGFTLLVSAMSLVFEYPEATGVNLTKSMPLRAFYETLSSLKSPINWRVRYHFAQKHAPVPYLYFSLDILRILIGYTLRQSKAFLSDAVYWLRSSIRV